METVKLDLDSLTLEEMAEVEEASGRSFDSILRGVASRRLMVLFVTQLRAHRAQGNPTSPSYVPAPSWRELGALRPLGD